LTEKRRNGKKIHCCTEGGEKGETGGHQKGKGKEAVGGGGKEDGEEARKKEVCPSVREGKS